MSITILDSTDKNEILSLIEQVRKEILENVTVTVDQSIWSGRRFIAFGTSITWACQTYSGGYLEVIKDRCGFASYLNAGANGAAMANNTANGSGINRTIRNTNIAAYDLVLIECSTNDFKLEVPLGNVGQIGDTEFDTNTFCGALRDSIEYILENDPQKHILLISDTQRDNAGYDVNYTNSAGCKLIDYVNALVEIGALYGLPVCDWYRNSGINALTLATYTKDGLHPNDTGYAVLGNLTASAVENMYCVFAAGSNSGEDEPEVTEKTLTSISATYSGGDVEVGTAVNNLPGVTIYAHYSDGSSATVTGYTLSGMIAEGSNTITASYQGKITAFTVIGVANSGGGSGGVEPDESTATINGTTYDISVASGYDHKMIMDLNGQLYLYYSNSPFFVEKGNSDKPDARFEVFAEDACRIKASGSTFDTGNVQIGTNATNRDMGDGYRSMTVSVNRTITQYIWTNHDLKYWGTDEVAVSATVQ